MSVFGSVPAGDDTLLTQIVANAVREGFHVVLCAPGTDTPVCTLPVCKQKQDHECGTAHVLSLESLLGPPLPFFGDQGEFGYMPKDRAKVRAKVQAIINRVTKQHDGVKPNIGVIPGPSGYVVMATQPDRNYGPTIRIRNRSGLFYMWWYSIPTPMPDRTAFILVPPSVIDGEPYELIGQTSPAPAWLLERITQS